MPLEYKERTMIPCIAIPSARQCLPKDLLPEWRKAPSPGTERKGLSSSPCASISRILYPYCYGPPPSIWGRTHARPLATYPPGSGGQPFSDHLAATGTPVYMVFQPVGFTKPLMLPATLVGSYPTFSPLPRRSEAVSLSAALSVTLRFPLAPLPVRKHGALRLSLIHI